MAGILAVYEPEVRHGTATFELEPPGVAEFGQRLARLQGLGLPWLVAECAGRIAAYAYAAPYHTRPAYRFTVEDSVYVSPAARGQGLGRALLDAVIREARAAGMGQMVAVIGDTGNLGSIRLHEACGFAHVGILRAVGFKFDRWLDTVLMQRPI